MAVKRIISFATLAFHAAAIFLFSGCASKPVDRAGGPVPVSAPARILFPNLTVNGHPMRLALDTGAASTVFYNAPAVAAGLTFGPPRHDVSTGAFEIVTEMSSVARLRWAGNETTTRVPVYAVPSPAAREDGVVGWPEVRDAILRFDPLNHSVESLSEPPTSATPLKVRPHDTLLLETPLEDGKLGLIFVDSGAPQGIQLARSRWEKFRAAPSNAPLTNVQHSSWSTGTFSVSATLAKAIALGTIELVDVPVEQMPAAQEAWLAKIAPEDELLGVLGMAALARMDLVADARNGRAWATPLSHGYGAENWTVLNTVQLHPDSLLVRSGIDYCTTSEFAKAIVDLNEALQVNPKNGNAYANRALARLAVGDAGGCIEDDTRALVLAGEDPSVYSVRALARQIQGDFEHALNDYDRAIRLAPGNSWDARLHRHTLRLRLGRGGNDLSAEFAALTDEWTKSTVLFVSNKLKEREFLDAATSNNQKCEAYYYAGMMRLCAGDKIRARELFEKSVATQVREYSEYHLALAELARLTR